jgi:hypothetical protein
MTKRPKGKRQIERPTEPTTLFDSCEKCKFKKAIKKLKTFLLYVKEHKRLN